MFGVHQLGECNAGGTDGFGLRFMHHNILFKLVFVIIKTQGMFPAELTCIGQVDLSIQIIPEFTAIDRMQFFRFLG